jgi:sugar phosphate isomerase/epimerase
MASPSTPKVSCRLELLPGDGVRAQLEAAAQMGFNGVALPGRFLDRWLKPLRECLANSPVEMAGISLGFSGSLLSPRESVRRECRESMTRLLDLCVELKVGWINFPPCLIQDNPERITEAGNHGSLAGRLDTLLLEQLPALGDAADARGVLLLIEPVNRYESDYLNSIEHAARLCAQLNHPAIGCTADFFHMQMEELNTAKAINAAGLFGKQKQHLPIRHVHVAENTRVEPGPGSLDFEPGFRALKTLGYGGWLEIEARRLSGPANEVLPKSADYLRKTWRTA